MAREEIENLKSSLLSKEIKNKLDSKPSEQTLQESDFLRLARKIPFFAQFISRFVDTGKGIGSLLGTEGLARHAIHTTVTDLQISTLALTALDWIKIPAMYVFAALAREKLPFKLSRGVKFAYTSAVLALSITAFAVPAIAPFLIITLTCMGLGSSIFILAKAFRDRQKLNAEMSSLETQITERKQTLNEQLEKTVTLENELHLNQNDELLNTVTKLHLKHIKEQIDLEENKHGSLQSFIDRQRDCAQALDKIKKEHMTQKAIGLGLASMAVSGAILSLFFPPAGIALLIAASTIGLSIGLAKVLGPPITHWFNKTFQKNISDERTEIKEETQPLIQEELTLDDSTVLTMHELFHEHEKKALQKLIQESETARKTETALITLITNHNETGILHFFASFSEKISEQPCSYKDLESFFSEHLTTLHSALAHLSQDPPFEKISKKELEDLRREPMNTFLKRQQFDIEKLLSEYHQKEASIEDDAPKTMHITPHLYHDEES